VVLVWVGSAADLDRYREGRRKVLPNDDGSFDQGVARVIVESTAGNIFKLLVANIFGLLGLFAHIRIWLVVWFGLAVQPI
jgi:hypothetical protein